MLYIVIPVFNRKEFTRACLLSLRQQTDPAFRVVVVDDGSTDGTGPMLRQEFAEVLVEQGDGNLFWTAGVNQGIRRALAEGATQIMTLNNDVLAAPDFVAQMQAVAAHHPTAVLGALELVSDKASKRGFDPALGLADRLFDTGYRNGLVFRSFGDHILGFAPALCFTADEFAQMGQRLKKTLDDVLSAPDVRAALK